MKPKESNYLTQRIESTTNLKGMSMFLPIPDRSCQEMGISIYMCTCNIGKDDSVNPKLIQNIVFSLINYINENILQEFKHLCQQIRFKKVINSKKFSGQEKYSVIFETTPNNAIFDATVMVNETISLVGNIIRISMYELTSHCMESRFFKNYCYCRNQLNVTRPG